MTGTFEGAFYLIKLNIVQIRGDGGNGMNVSMNQLLDDEYLREMWISGERCNRFYAPGAIKRSWGEQLLEWPDEEIGDFVNMFIPL